MPKNEYEVKTLSNFKLVKVWESSSFSKGRLDSEIEVELHFKSEKKQPIKFLIVYGLLVIDIEKEDFLFRFSIHKMQKNGKISGRPQWMGYLTYNLLQEETVNYLKEEKPFVFKEEFIMERYKEAFPFSIFAAN